MREIAGEAAGSSSDKDVTEEERNRAFKAAWEAMLVDGMDGNLGDGGLEGIGEAPGKSERKEGGPGGFQDKIKQAMDKLKESESKAQVRLLVALGFLWNSHKHQSRVRLALAQTKIQSQWKLYFNHWAILVLAKGERTKQSWLASWNR